MKLATFHIVDLEVDKIKSATSAESSKGEAKFLEEHEGYKCLGVLEDRKHHIKAETKQKIVENIYDRVSKVCKSKLNARNLFHAINGHANSLMSYYTGPVEFEPHDLQRLIMVSEKS